MSKVTLMKNRFESKMMKAYISAVNKCRCKVDKMKEFSSDQTGELSGALVLVLIAVVVGALAFVVIKRSLGDETDPSSIFGKIHQKIMDFFN